MAGGLDTSVSIYVAAGGIFRPSIMVSNLFFRGGGRALRFGEPEKSDRLGEFALAPLIRHGINAAAV
jgi:hypothetical protein